MMNRLYARIKKFYIRAIRCINGTKGAISLFLAVLMVPFASVTGVLLDAARLNSAVALFDEALCNASNSTLGTYDTFLRDRFGLLAISQDPSKVGRAGQGYTAQDLINETFQKYMEECGFVLSSTYEDVETSATGVYPLSDPNVLMSQVLEYSKYTVPAKLVDEGLQIDNIINTFTKDLNIVSKALDTGSSLFKMGGAGMDCETAFNKLLTEFDEYNAAKTDYNAGYTNFEKSANAYNSVLYNRTVALNRCRNVLQGKETTLQTKTAERDNAKSKVQHILNTINSLENQKDVNGNPVDNSKLIENITEANEEALQPYYDAEAAYETAKSERDAAQSDLERTEQDYETKVNDARSDLSTKKNEYCSSISGFATATQELGNAVSDAASKYVAMKNEGVTFLKNAVSTTLEATKLSAKGKEEQLKDQKKKAEEDLAELRKNNASQTDIDKKQAEIDQFDKDITAAKDEQTKISNGNTMSDAYYNAEKTYITSLEQLANEKLMKEFDDQYYALLDLEEKVERDYKIPQSYSSAPETTAYYTSYDISLTKENVEELLENALTDVVESSFIAFIKAAISFFDAIFNIELIYDPELTATIDKSLYSNIGGLPSESTKTSESPYAQADQELSEKYIESMKSFTDNGEWPEDKDPFQQISDSIQAELTNMGEIVNSQWTIFNMFSKMWSIVESIGRIAKLFGELVVRLLACLGEYIYKHTLSAGYFAYNLANRTNYTSKSGLTGSYYKLNPTVANKTGASDTPQYTFYGAEAEYLIVGSDKEWINQTVVFGYVYLLRVVCGAPFVFANSEVATFAAEASAATAIIGGVGGYVVYILYCILEPLIDTVLLVNNATVPIIKSKIYLTPSGIPELLSKIIGMGFSQANKEKLYNKSAETIGALTKSNDTNYASTYKDAVSAYEKEKPGINTEGAMPDAVSKLTNSFVYTYTSKLFIIMLFVGNSTMAKRFADIVQMEATYNVAVDRKVGNDYVFDLHEAYTYVRASGQFEMTPFLSAADALGLIASERVVYRGY